MNRDFIINGCLAPTWSVFKRDVGFLMVSDDIKGVLISFDNRESLDGLCVGLYDG